MKAIKKIQAIKYCMVMTILFVIVDQITKAIAQWTNCKINLIAGFGLRYVENRGWAFGLFSNTKYAAFIGLIINFIFIVIILIYYRRFIFTEKDMPWVLIFALTMVISGAIGSMIDRAFWGFARDFISIPRYAIINFSDIYSVVGCFFIIYTEISRNDRFKKIKANLKFK